MSNIYGNIERHGPRWAWARIDAALRTLVNSTQVSECFARELREAVNAINAETKLENRI